MLDWRSMQLLAKRGKEAFTSGAVIAVDADLDQLVTGQTGIDLPDYRFGEAALAYRDYGIQGMGTSAQRAAFVGSEVEHAGYLFGSCHSSGFWSMNRSRSSSAWLHEHVTDTYVQRARADGYRSRASYKLAEMDDRDHLIRPGEVVVDLGATPGGWSQVAAKRMQGKGRIIAVDLLEMEPLRGVTFVQGDFREQQVLEVLEKLLLGEKVGLVLSDMSPNLSGISVSDQARGTYLAELALEFARSWLKPNGAFLVKVFQGCGFTDFLVEMRKTFKVVSIRKPDASRDRSPEVYLLGRTLKA